MNPPGDSPYDPGHSPYGNPGAQQPHPQQGPSSPQQGWQPPPQQPHQTPGQPGGGPSGPFGGGAAPPASGRGFFAALFDFQFRSLITTRIIRIVFVLLLVLIAVFTLSGAASSFGLMSVSPLTGLLTLLGSLVGGAVAVVLTRVGLEVVIVLFRISDDLSAIRARGGM